MKNKFAKRLVVAAILTSCVVSSALTSNAATYENGSRANGGAIDNSAGASLTIESNSLFQGNTATAQYQGGGAIYNAAQGHIEIGDGVTFNKNYLTGVSTAMNGTVGGAIASWGGSSVSIGNNASFTNNGYADSTLQTIGAASGGAVYMSGGGNGVDPQAVLTIGSNANFLNNVTTGAGAAIYGEGASITIGSDSIFDNNYAESGAAAIYNYQFNNVASTVTVGDRTQFTNNTAKNDSGGAISNFFGNLNLGNKLAFRNNTAGYAGGAIRNAGTLTIGSDAIFENNYAKADDNGGGAISNSGSLTIGDNAIFTVNKADYCGGAIYNTSAAEINNATFSQNEAGVDGGAIYSTGLSGVLNITNSNFTGNESGDWGGAIGNFKGGSLTVLSSSFTNNIANKTGGAIASGTTSSISVDGAKFINNHALHGDGGAIGNFGSLDINNVTFEGNTAQLLEDANGNYTVQNTDDPIPVGGGALALGAVSASKIATIANTIFKNNKSGVNGGAIGTRLAADASNVGAKLDIAARFEGNVAYQNGGAIYNTFYANNGLNKGEGVTIVGEFINNHANQNGGAIYNDAAIDKSSNAGGVLTVLGGSVFDGNSADGLGGAIYNTGKVYLDTTNGDITFTNNTDSTGKNDIYMADGSELTLLGSNTLTIGSGLDSENTNATITNNGVNFIFADNAINSYEGKYIHNAGQLILGANVASFKDYKIESGSGAELIVDDTAILSNPLVVNGNDAALVTDLANVQFNGDITPSTGSVVDAIRTGHFSYNGTDVDINGAGLTLSNNSVIDEANLVVNGTETGGVRYLGFGDGSGTTGDITLGANAGLQYKDGAYINGDSTLLMGDDASLIFNNNSSSIDYDVTIQTTGSAARIVMNGTGTTNISSELSDKVDIQSNSGVLNLTKDELTVGDLSVSGENTTLNLFGDVTGGNALVNKATLGVYGNSELGSLSLGSTLAMQNGVINNLNVGSFSLNADSNITFDVNPRSGLTDTINANTFTNTNSSNLLVTGITLTEAPTSANFNIDLNNILTATTGDTAGVVQLEDSVIANSQMGRYLITSSGAGSPILNASLMAINPQMYRGQVATLASWQNQLVVNNMLFDHMAVLGRQLMDDAKTANLKAAAYPQFAPYQYSIKDGSLWYKAYGNFERISMTKGLSVGNNTYGSLIGADFPLVNLKNGWKLVPTAYVGYNGAHQHFDGVSMYQNGAQLGFMGTAYKNDFITSLLAYGGGYANDMTVRGTFGNGSDTTGNWFAGVASKSAYNFHIAKDLIFQPTAMIAYNAFGGQNWGSNFGTMSMSTGMLNGLNMAPGFNLILNKKSFSLYATAQMVYNIMGGVDGNAGNIDLGYVRMRHSYFEYGLGVMKQFKDRFNGYLQFTIRNGGRTGIGFQGGLQIKVGK